MSLSPRLWSTGLLISATVLGCAYGGARRPVPTPIPIPVEQLPQARDQIIEIARKQAYDLNPGASDRIEIEDGIEITIEPQDGAYRLSRKELAGGRVIGRFINHSDKVIRRYSLAPRGTTYWVVYEQKGEWLAAFISDGRSRELDRFGMKTVLHPPTRPWLQSIAQWQLPDVIHPNTPGGAPREMRNLVLAGKTVLPWGSCGPEICCATDPDPPPPQ
jgi:hypothetical protein